MMKTFSLFVGSLIAAVVSIVGSPPTAGCQGTHVFEPLQKSTRTGTVKPIQAALSAYEALSTEEKESFLDSFNADSVFRMCGSIQTLLLRSRPSEEVFLLNSQLMDIVTNCAKCSEGMDEYFGDWFVKHVEASLSVLGRVSSDKLMNDVCERACFKGGNASRILRFIRSHTLTHKKYYKLFLRCEDASPDAG